MPTHLKKSVEKKKPSVDSSHLVVPTRPMDVNDSLLPFTQQSHKLKCLSRLGDVEEIKGGCFRGISVGHKEMASYTGLTTPGCCQHPQRWTET